MDLERLLQACPPDLRGALAVALPQHGEAGTYNTLVRGWAPDAQQWLIGHGCAHFQPRRGFVLTELGMGLIGLVHQHAAC